VHRQLAYCLCGWLNASAAVVALPLLLMLLPLHVDFLQLRMLLYHA
jgi:hypothetical protein